MQLSDDYEARFAAGDTPWEDEVVSPMVSELVSKYGSPGVAVLDVGCGPDSTRGGSRRRDST